VLYQAKRLNHVIQITQSLVLPHSHTSHTRPDDMRTRLTSLLDC